MSRGQGQTWPGSGRQYLGMPRLASNDENQGPERREIVGGAARDLRGRRSGMMWPARHDRKHPLLTVLSGFNPHAFRPGWSVLGAYCSCAQGPN
jgi:hypothetical protein